MSEEQSQNGQPIRRYEGQSPKEWAEPDMTNNSIEAIDSHIENHIGPVGKVFHEIRSNQVHIDIHIVNPAPERPYYTLITSGMSDLPMNAPPGREACRHAELMLCLPPTWALAEEDLKVEANYWPLRQLKMMARFPHVYDTWFWEGHTIQNGNPPEPFAANTAMNFTMLVRPMTVSTAFWQLPVNETKTIHFFALLPLYLDEAELKLKKGYNEVIARFEKAKYSEIIKIDRKSVAANPWWKVF
jgi:hypothetical protein